LTQKEALPRGFLLFRILRIGGEARSGGQYEQYAGESNALSRFAEVVLPAQEASAARMILIVD
jgi:hypothetical protein